MKVFFSAKDRASLPAPRTLKLLEKAVSLCMIKMRAASDQAVSLFFTDNAEIAALNKRFRGLDQATDVLSFSMNKPRFRFRGKDAGSGARVCEGDEKNPGAGAQRRSWSRSREPSRARAKPRTQSRSRSRCVERDGEETTLGEVIISVERAAEQAAEYGHSIERELAFLTAHGTLHLLGLDHEDRVERARMEEYQRQILFVLGLSR